MRPTNTLRTYKYRFVFLVVILCAAIMLLIARLANTQIVKGDYYSTLSDRKIGKTVTLSAPRGEILDRYGRPLVTNRMAFEVVINKTGLAPDRLNQILIDTLALVEKRTLAYTDPLPISSAPYQFLTSADAAENEKLTAQQAKLKKDLKLTADATASDVIDKLKQKYSIEGFTEAGARTLCGLRYEMNNRSFSVKYPFTIASDVDIATVTKIKERSISLPCVEVETSAIREYGSGSLAAHILGTTGGIYKDEAESYLAKGYTLNDVIGKDGIEKTMEDYLRGKPGTQYVEVTSSGKVVGSEVIKQAVPGNNVYLTIDKRLQEVAEESLARTIQKIAQSGKSSGAGADACAGSAVVVDVNTGEVLAMASYPTFDLNKYYSNYTAYSTDPTKPLFNRAIAGTYAPGSTFKMATAIAALESGAITTSTIVTCTGKYAYYAPQIFKCWIYTDYGRGHGPMNVRLAIKNSCNYFFYECGRLMGINTLVKWEKKLGLGTKTGIELTGEASGIVASPESREKAGRPWYAGDTLQAAIGQSDNLFTPLQLAAYVATIVNGGTRYQSHLVKSILSYDGSNKVVDTKPVALSNIGMNDTVYSAVMNGMGSVTEDGTASSVFGNYKIKVGGKTGTASVPNGTANGVFVAFAPYDNPEIAVAVIVEHGAHGNSVAPIAKDIFNAYFSGSGEDVDAPGENELLG